MLNKLVKDIEIRVRGKNKIVVVPEGNEIRVIKSLKYTQGLTKKLIGDADEIKSLIKEIYPEDSEKILKDVIIVNPEQAVTEKMIDRVVEIRKGKTSKEEAKKLLKSNVYIATMLLEMGEADALVGGSFYCTSEILKPAFQLIKSDTNLVSSYFLMEKDNRFQVYADCAVNVDPNVEQLKEIGYQTFKSAEKLGISPKMAFLSYSTKGSGAGKPVDKVRKATELFYKEHPDLIDDVCGEMQFDAAISYDICKLKLPESEICGKINTFIFPNLEAGNIGYKITQTLANWNAIGPLTQGFRKPVNDLSRGTTPKVIADVMYLSFLNE